MPSAPLPPDHPHDLGLRHEVRLLATRAGLRRRLPVRCHVGLPGGEVVVLPDLGSSPEERAVDLRAALVERALDGLERHEEAACWVTRSGELEPGREDHAWWAAACHGFAAHDLRPSGCYLLTRRGWVEATASRGRTWARVRPLPPASAQAAQVGQVCTGSLACLSSM